jgi:hypothetical protein
LLIKHGGDPHVKNARGLSSFDLARSSDARGPNRPCPTGRDGKPGSPQKVAAAKRMLAILKSATPASRRSRSRGREAGHDHPFHRGSRLR